MAEHKVEKIDGGYILLARQILNSEIMDKPPMFLKLWVWMLERAHHKNGHKGLKRAQFLTSVKEMQDAMTHRVGARIVRPSSRKVRYMYERLSNCHMIDRSNVSEGMLITILNYNKYQDPKNYERPSELSHELSRELSPLYNKKECSKKEKNGITPPLSPPQEKSKITGKELKDENPWLEKKTRDDFITHREDIKHPLTSLAITKAINFLEKYQNFQQMIVDQTIINDWRGLFPPRGGMGKAQSLHEQKMAKWKRRYEEKYA